MDSGRELDDIDTLALSLTQVDPSEAKPDPEDQGPKLDSLDFWHKLIACLVSVIEEDRNIYSPKMNQFPHELNVGQQSAATIFSLLAVDIKYALEEHEQHRLCESSAYMNLNFAVKRFYVKHIKDVPPYNNLVPEYPAWFEPFVMQWLNENDDVSLEYLKGAYARDKKDGVSSSPYSASSLSSLSILWHQTLNVCIVQMHRTFRPPGKVSLLMSFLVFLHSS
jgi:protein unc-13 A/B/C